MDCNFIEAKVVRMNSNVHLDVQTLISNEILIRLINRLLTYYLQTSASSFIIVISKMSNY